MSFNLATMLRESARSRPEKVAVILDQFRLDYQTVDALSNQLAGSLTAAGVRRGDRVGLMLPNVPQFVIAYYGILKAGAVMVPMNVLLKAPEVAFYVGDSEARVLITWEDFAAEAVEGVSQLSGVATYVANRPGSEARPEGTRPFTELLQGSPAFDMVPTDPDDTAVILYTSGTTGKPKGAELTHLNLFMCCQVGADRLVEFKDDDVGLAVLPLFHSFGQSNVMNTTIYAGGTITMVPRFDADKVLEVIQRDRVTIFAGVPTMYFALLHHPSAADYDTSSLRMCVSGGVAMPGEVMKGYFKKPEATAEVMKGGWFHSGDMGYVDEEGYFFIVDRKKELIIRGGFNVYPREVEEVLYAHPAVQEAAVIGIPDEKFGEEVKAVVSLKAGQSATEEELIGWTKERVAAYKYPRSVQFVETLPKGPTGKILKKELKQQLEATAR